MNPGFRKKVSGKIFGNTDVKPKQADIRAAKENALLHRCVKFVPDANGRYLAPDGTRVSLERYSLFGSYKHNFTHLTSALATLRHHLSQSRSSSPKNTCSQDRNTSDPSEADARRQAGIHAMRREFEFGLPVAVILYLRFQLLGLDS